MSLTSLVTYSLSIWFIYYLLNHAELTKPFGDFVKEAYGSVSAKLLGCPFCTAFWTLFIGWYLFGMVEGELVLTAPVVVLFVELAYQRLAVGPTITVTQGDISYTGPATRP